MEAGCNERTVDGESKELPATVIVVDDEGEICKSLAGVLGDEGFRTLSATCGEDALELVRVHRPEVVFLDIWMPGKDGIETLDLIKSISPKTEVIVISGHASIANALEATKRGAFDFIEKPLDIESVVIAAERALASCRRNVEHVGVSKDSSGTNESAPQPKLRNPGMRLEDLRGRNLGQRTLARSFVLYGKGLHSGQKSGLVLEPLPRNSGIHFAKIGDSRSVPAYVDNVVSTANATTVRSGPTSAATIEHLMAALHAYRVSNLLVKCNGEVPILDGSALEFCEAIEEAGIEEQGGEWFEIVSSKAISVSSGRDGGAGVISLEPGEGFSISYEMDYPEPVGRQSFLYGYESAEQFKSEIAPARTFGFIKDIESLQRAGLAAGGSLDNFILIGSDKVINTDLRFPEEMARHKILDIIGDTFMLGRPLSGRIRARMSGHSDNLALVTELRRFMAEA